MKATLPGLALLCLLASNSWASNLDAKFALHRVPVPELFDGCGSDNPNALQIPCDSYTVAAPLGESYVFLVLADTGEEGVWGVRFGLNYGGRAGQHNGIDPASAAFTACNRDGSVFLFDNGYGEFPAPQGTVVVIFSDGGACYEHPVIGSFGRHVLVGFVYLVAEADDVLSVIPDYYVDPHRYAVLEISDCSSPHNIVDLVERWSTPEALAAVLGRVHFGGDGSAGNDPCFVTPVRPTTWGRLKATFAP